MIEDQMAELKAELKAWNTQLRDWEAKLLSTQGALQTTYVKDLAVWREQLREAAGRLRELNITSDVNSDRAREVEAALAEVSDMFRRVRARLGPGASE